MKALLSWLNRHLGWHRETYVFAPLAFAGLFAAILYVGRLTGRDTTEDLGSLVGSMVNLCRVALVAIAVGLLQEHFYGHRSIHPNPSIWDDAYDATITTGLFAAIGYIVFFL